MFWIGFAAGTAASCLIIIVAISAIGWSIGKERTANVRKMDRYWQESLEVQERNAETFERIERLIDLGQR